MCMCQCPVFLKRSWLLGRTSLSTLQDESVPEERVKKVLKEHRKHYAVDFFSSKSPSWRCLATAQMSTEQLRQAKEAWKPGPSFSNNLYVKVKREMFQHMRSYMRDHLKWNIAHLHDASVCIGSCPPSALDHVSYFKILHHPCESAQLAWQPQNRNTHVKAAYKKSFSCCNKVDVV